MPSIPVRLTSDGGEQVIAVVCPDCGGTLRIVAQGTKNRFVFRCRVGHRYSVTDLLAAKEECLENQLWTAVQSLEEIADVLSDLLTQARRQGLDDAARALEERQARAASDARVLRGIIDRNRAVEITAETPDIRGGTPP